MLLGTIIFVLAGIIIPREVYGRAIDDLDDNRIEPSSNIVSGDGSSNVNGGIGHRTLFESEDWVKVVKAPPEKIVQTLGSTIELTCEIMGAPLPTIQWIRGHPSDNGFENYESNALSETSSTSIVRVRSVLIIDHVLPNERTFTCVGQSSGQTVYATTTIYPSSKSQNLPELLALNNKAIGPKKAKIVYNYPMVLDNVESNVILPCKAIGRPRPEIYWMDSNGIITGDDPRFKILPSGELLISNLKWADMGAYKCVARNTVGKDTAATFIYPVSKEE